MSYKFSLLLASFVMLLSVSAHASDNDTITVNAQGSVHGVPDTMLFTLWVESQGTKLTPLKTQVDQITETLLRDLQSRDIERKDLRSFRLNIQPKYERHGDQMRQDGFQVTRQIEVTLRDTEHFDEIIDFALAQGVTRVGQINYRIDDTRPLAQQAMLNAIDNAHDKAALMAKHSQRELGDIISIREVQGGTPGIYMRAESSAMNLSEPGQEAVNVNIEVVFRLN
ncbi:SIMPL domain-containing protein [Aliidiomarina sp. Khilg15.8]